MTKQKPFEIFARLKVEDDAGESMLVVYRHCHAFGVVILSPEGLIALGFPKADALTLIQAFMAATERTQGVHTCGESRDIPMKDIIQIFKDQPLENVTMGAH